MPTVVGSTRIPHRRLILLCGCSLLYPPLGLTLGPHPSLGLSALSLRVQTFLFSFTRLRAIFLPSGFLCEHLYVLSHPSLGCIPSLSSDLVYVSFSLLDVHLFNNILQIHGCSSHSYARSLRVTL
jgi:hypothetical protein